MTILPSGAPDAGPDSLVAFLARELDTVSLWLDRTRRAQTETGSGEVEERLAYEIYWKNKRIDRQDLPQLESGKIPTPYPTLIDQDLQALSSFMPAGQKHPKLTVAELPRFYPKYAGEKAFLGRFQKLVTAADYPMLWCTYSQVWNPAAPEQERLETWGHLGFQKEDGRSAAARLTHGDPAARRGAVEALASCSPDEARPGLQAALADDDAEVRLAAASVVALRPDRGLSQDLADRLADEDVRVRAAAARGLREMGIPETAEPLQEVALEDEVEVRRAAIAALAHIDVASARATLIAAARKDKDPEVRRWAAEGLGRATFAEAAPELGKLLADKDAAVRATSARSLARATARPEKAPAKLVDALRKVASKDPSEETRADAIRTLRALAPEDKEGLDLAMKLAATQAKAGDLKDLAVKLSRGQEFPTRDKRITTALLKRIEKEPSADAIIALGNQGDDRLLDAVKSLISRLWGKTPDEEGIAKSAQAGLAEARAAVPYALARIQEVAIAPLLLKILDLERARKAPEDKIAANAEENWRVSTCFTATEALLALAPQLKAAELEKVNERFTVWLGEPGAVLDAGGSALRRAALLAFGAPAQVVATDPSAPAPMPVPVVPATPVKIGKNASAKIAAPAVPAKPVVVLVPPALPNKAIIPIARGMLADMRWPEAAQVLSRQLGFKAAPLLAAALEKGIDKEVRVTKKGGYSKRDAELVATQRRGIILALRELKDLTVIPTIVRLLTLEALRAGKIERKTESSLLGITITTLQSLTGYKFGAEPQRWQEVATGKLPLVAEPPKKSAAPAKKGSVTALPAGKKGAAPVTAKKAAVPAKKAAPVKPASKAKVVAKGKPAAKKPVAKKPASKLRKPAKATGAKKVSQPRRMAAKSARRR